MAPKLFGTAGIRGKYLELVTPQLAYSLGLAVSVFTGRKGTVTVGHDIRTTSPLLALSVASGLMSGGTDAVYIGMQPTPIVAYSSPKTHSKAGIVVTASHNPPPDNGLKVYDEKGMEYTERMEEEIEKLMVDGEEYLAGWDDVGRLTEHREIGNIYVEDLLAVLYPESKKYTPKIHVDCGNGAASNYTPNILYKMGAKIATTNCYPNGYFPGRHPEPRQDVLEPLLETTKAMEAHILLAHDGDADRLAALTPKNGFVKQDYLVAIYAMYKLRNRKGEIIVSIDIGNAVVDVVERMGGKIVRGKLGKTHEKLLEYPNALLAAEPWKLIDPSWGPWVDGIYQASLLTKILMEEGKTLDDFLEELPRYYWSRISIPLESQEDKNKLYESMSENIITEAKESSSVTLIDGIRIDYDDKSWILVRKSGTEPKIRFYMEAQNRERLEELKNKLLGTMKKTAEKHNIKFGTPVVNTGR